MLMRHEGLLKPFNNGIFGMFIFVVVLMIVVVIMFLLMTMFIMVRHIYLTSTLKLFPKLRQIFPVTSQVVIQNFLRCVNVCYDWVKQEALQGFLTISFDGSIHT